MVDRRVRRSRFLDVAVALLDVDGAFHTAMVQGRSFSPAPSWEPASNLFRGLGAPPSPVELHFATGLIKNSIRWSPNSLFPSIGFFKAAGNRQPPPGVVRRGPGRGSRSLSAHGDRRGRGCWGTVQLRHKILPKKRVVTK